MKIAIVASEAVPFAKTGGLADVTGALPKALFRLGHEPILILPLHRAVRRSGAALLRGGKHRRARRQTLDRIAALARRDSRH